MAPDAVNKGKRPDYRIPQKPAPKADRAVVRAYHLTSAEHAISNLKHRRLKIATFDDLNDPFELWAVAQSDPELRRGLRGWKQQMTSRYGVLCFSKTWHNPVLWSHYGDRHRGVALGFDINADMTKEVTYSARRPIFRKADEKSLHTLLYTKHCDWQYEDEVRVFARLKERDEATRLYFGEFTEQLVLREIIVGPLSKITKHEIQDALRDASITITKGRLAFKTFDVVRNGQGFSEK